MEKEIRNLCNAVNKLRNKAEKKYEKLIDEGNDIYTESTNLKDVMYLCDEIGTLITEDYLHVTNIQKQDF